MGSQRLQLRQEDLVGAEQGLDAHRRNDVGDGAEPGEVFAGEEEHPEHPVGPVDEGETFLHLEHDRSGPGASEGVSSRGRQAVRPDNLALAHEDERAVGQGRQVAATPEGAGGRDDRRDPGVEQGGEVTGHDRAHPGTATGQSLQAQEHESAHDFGFHRLTEAGRMGPDEAGLELGPQLGIDVTGGKGAKARRNAVSGGRGGGKSLHDAARSSHFFDGFSRKLDHSPLARNGEHLSGSDTPGVERDEPGGLTGRPAPRT